MCVGRTKAVSPGGVRMEQPRHSTCFQRGVGCVLVEQKL
jgi:hypothetical protein